MKESFNLQQFIQLYESIQCFASFSAIFSNDTRVDVVDVVFDRVNFDVTPEALRSRPVFSWSRGFLTVAERRTLLTTFCIEGSAVLRTASRKRVPADASCGEVSVLSADEGEVMRCAGRIS